MRFRIKSRFFIIFFVSSLAVLTILSAWYYQKNRYSKDVLKLEILASSEVNLAEEISYTVKYKNNGDIRLEKPRLIFEYPENTVYAEDEIAGIVSSEGDSLRREKPLEDIYPGQEKIFVFKARLLGRENEPLTAKAWLNYQPKNLKARYESSTSHTVIIKNAPITFEFDLPSKAKPEDAFSFRLNYFSNVDYPLTDLRIKINYPSGFSFAASRPKGLEKDEWSIPVLNKAEGGRMEISGRLSGSINEEKGFKAVLGTWHNSKFILLKETNRSIVMTEPSIYIYQKINGSQDYITFPGDRLHFEVYFKNLGDSSLTDLYLISKIDSPLIDLGTISAEKGRLEPGGNSIVFDSQNVSELQFLAPGEEGKVDFWAGVKGNPQSVAGQLFNPVIRHRVSLSQVQKDFDIKVSSGLPITQKGYYQDEVFGNSGPIPPKVGEVTTYTITWQVKNYYNSVKNARLKAILAPEVRLTGLVFPENQLSKLAFDPNSREIVWELGDLNPWQGFSSSAPSISFQIALTPQMDQRDQIVSLINEPAVIGDDDWTNQVIVSRVASLNSSLPDDGSVGEGGGRVQ